MQANAGYLPLLFGALLLLGCQRKLPGPEECRSFALQSIGVEPATPASQLAYHPELMARAESLTRQCLTTPWDYELLSCVSTGRSSRSCLRSFEARRLGSQ